MSCCLLPQKLDLVVTRGDTQPLSLRLKQYDEDDDGNMLPIDELPPYDLTGADVLMHVRRAASDVVFLIEASVTGGQIVINEPEGIIDIEIPADDNSQVGNWVYDIELIYADGTVQTPIRGCYTITQDVSRA